MHFRWSSRLEHKVLDISMCFLPIWSSENQLSPSRPAKDSPFRASSPSTHETSQAASEPPEQPLRTFSESVAEGQLRAFSRHVKPEALTLTNKLSRSLLALHAFSTALFSCKVLPRQRPSRASLTEIQKDAPSSSGPRTSR